MGPSLWQSCLAACLWWQHTQQALAKPLLSASCVALLLVYSVLRSFACVQCAQLCYLCGPAWKPMLLVCGVLSCTVCASACVPLLLVRSVQSCTFCDVLAPCRHPSASAAGSDAVLAVQAVEATGSLITVTSLGAGHELQLVCRLHSWGATEGVPSGAPLPELQAVTPSWLCRLWQGHTVKSPVLTKAVARLHGDPPLLVQAVARPHGEPPV